jgi:type I restriction enzyme, S subunit
MRTVRLGDLLVAESGGTPPRGRPDYYGGSVPWAKIQDLTRAGRVLRRTEEQVTPTAVLDCRLPLFEAGTVLLAMYGSIGVSSIAGVATTSNQAILGLRPNSDVLSEYLWLYLQSVAPSLAASGRGGTQRNVNASMVKELRVPLPTVDEQRTFAHAVERDLEFAHAIRVGAVARLRSVELLREQGLREALNGCWATTRLGDVASIQLGKMLSPAAKLGVRPVKYIRNANVQWDRLQLEDVSEMDFTAQEERKFSLREGDVLVCEGGEPGRSAVWHGQIERCCFQKAVHRLRPINDQVDPQFLVYRMWLAALDGEFGGEHAKTTIAHLPAVRLRDLQVSLPPIAEQRRIAAELRERLATIDAMTRAIEVQREAIDALPAALLRRAFAEIEAA